MRGIAVLAAAAAGWVLVTGQIPRVGFALPTIRLRTALLAVAAFVTAFVLTYGLLDVLSVAVAIALLAGGTPIAVSQSSRARQEAEIRGRWPDILTHVRSSVGAGATLPDAVIGAMRTGGDRFEEMADLIRTEVAFGGGFRGALETIRREDDDPTTDRVLVTLSTANSTGGARVGEIVGMLGASVADETRLRRAHDAALTEQRMTVNVALVAPWALLCLSIATNTQARLAFSSAEGTIVVGIGFVATVLGWALANRTARLSRAPRVFR
ncbi:MAG: type II secretion system F family protein [Acidimicrobiia bacterium]